MTAQSPGSCQGRALRSMACSAASALLEPTMPTGKGPARQALDGACELRQWRTGNSAQERSRCRHRRPNGQSDGFITSLGGSAAVLGLIEGIADGLADVARLGGGALADDPARRRAALPLVAASSVRTAIFALDQSLQSMTTEPPARASRLEGSRGRGSAPRGFQGTMETSLRSVPANRPGD